MSLYYGALLPEFAHDQLLAAFLQAVPSYENIPTPTSLEDISPGGPTEMTEVTVYQDENKGAYTCGQGLELPLTDEELLLASPILYGFSFTEKLWSEYPHHRTAFTSTLLLTVVFSGIRCRERESDRMEQRSLRRACSSCRAQGYAARTC